MQDQAFADATRPAPRILLGVPLRRYSLGHELILQADKSPLLLMPPDELSKEPEKLRLALGHAIEVCSRTWAENQTEVKIRGGLRQPLKRADLVNLAVVFCTYRLEGSSCPQMFQQPSEDPDARTLGSPYLARILNFAALRYGLAGYDQPFGLLQWLYFTHYELEGTCCVANDLEIQINEEMAQHQADYAREQEEARQKEATECPQP